MSHPEWAAVGSTVAIKSRSSVVMAVVTRHTKTQIIVGERRFSLSKYGQAYQEIGAGNAWHPAPMLLPASDPEVVKLMRAQKVQSAVIRFRNAAASVEGVPTPSQIANAREWLEALERILEEKP